MKKLFTLLLAAVATLTMFGQTNLAVDQPSIATSGNAALGNDGNKGSRWESTHGVDPQLWQVDLGQAQTFNTISIIWEGAYGKTFDIIAGNTVGDDGFLTDGEVIYTVEGQVLAGFPYTQVIELPNTRPYNYRYVQFKGRERGTGYGYSFFEFGVYNLTEPLSLVSMTLSTAANETTIGTPVNLTLVGKNELGGAFEPTNVTWVVTPEIGTVTEGVFTANAVGTAKIKAVSGNIESNEVSILVTAGQKIDLMTNNNVRIYNLGLATSESKVGAFDDNDGSVWDFLGKTTGADEASRTYDVGFIADLRGIYDVTNISIHFEGACSEQFTLSFAGQDGVFGDAVYTGGVAGISNHTETFNSQIVNGVRYVKFLSTKAATEWSVKIFDFSVYGNLTESVEDTTNPTLESVEAGNATDTSITLNIKGDDNSSKYLAYEVNGTVYALGTNKAGVVAPVLIENLNGGTQYEFNVVAIDAFGNRSEPKTVIASTTGEVFVLTPAPVPTVPAQNVISIYSDAYLDATGWYFGNWAQATQTTRETIDGDEMLLLTKFNYIGLEFTTDLSLNGMEYLHIDVLPMQEMNLGVTPIMRPTNRGAAEHSLDVGTLTPREWNSINIPLSSYTEYGLDFENDVTFQLKLDGGDASKTLYVDNIYYWKTDITGVTDITAAKAADGNVYTLTGICLGKAAISDLPAGIYIYGGKKILVK